ncbi:hypothetical protein BZL30_2358 [Mycobacterium kansasii]|uniref:Uncharacterized protein n=1 Tax=Mycobacterium kansasii TaxID=1768 RepID=A0A1V3XHP4_MYCKA|nr:hypothetical protein BZL30_2358 [Mycobacterium kansasii]
MRHGRSRGFAKSLVARAPSHLAAWTGDTIAVAGLRDPTIVLVGRRKVTRQPAPVAVVPIRSIQAEHISATA